MNSPLRQFKAEIFQALAHPTRIAIVELLRNGELSAGRIMGELGVEQANASQHLGVLRSKHVVLSRKAGNQVFYTLRDPVLVEVLELLKEYFYGQIVDSARSLDEIHEEEASKRR